MYQDSVKTSFPLYEKINTKTLLSSCNVLIPTKKDFEKEVMKKNATTMLTCNLQNVNQEKQILLSMFQQNPYIIMTKKRGSSFLLFRAFQPEP